MWAIVPAAGRATRLQPLGFSKELLPIASRSGDSRERPRAVSEFLLDRLVLAGVDRIGMVIAPTKLDILTYYGATYGPAGIAYLIQPCASGLCDAVFQAAPLVPAGDTVIIGLPDTIWYPEDALTELPDDRLSCLLFPVEHPERFDAVALDATGAINAIEVKSPSPSTSWIWGAIKMPGRELHALRDLWLRRDKQDEYLGTLINAWIASGGRGWGIKAGRSYIDVGTVDSYRAAMSALYESPTDDQKLLRLESSQPDARASAIA